MAIGFLGVIRTGETELIIYDLLQGSLEQHNFRWMFPNEPLQSVCFIRSTPLQLSFPTTGTCRDTFTGLPIPFHVLGRYIPTSPSFIITPTTLLSEPDKLKYVAPQSSYQRAGLDMAANSTGATTDVVALMRGGSMVLGASIMMVDVQVSKVRGQACRIRSAYHA